MGRSVSVPSNAELTAYQDVSHIEDEWDYRDWIEDIKCMAECRWPSLERVDNEWLGNEERIILENSFIKIGVSEYCGLACIFVVNANEEESYYEDVSRLHNLAKGFISRIENKFNKEFGEYCKKGTFSDGTSFYTKINN